MDLVEHAERAVLTQIFRTFPDSFVWTGGSLLQILYHSARASLDLDLAPVGTAPDSESLLVVVSEALDRVNALLGTVLTVSRAIESSPGFTRLRVETLPAESKRTAFTVDVTRIGGGGLGSRTVPLASLLGTVPVRVLSDSALLSQKLRALLLRRFAKPGDLYDVWFLLQSGVRMAVEDRLALRDELGGKELDPEAIKERFDKLGGKGLARALDRAGVAGLDEAGAGEMRKTVESFVGEVLR